MIASFTDEIIEILSNNEELKNLFLIMMNIIAIRRCM